MCVFSNNVTKHTKFSMFKKSMILKISKTYEIPGLLKIQISIYIIFILLLLGINKMNII